MFYVYKIENLCNNKSYIGCSKKVFSRFKQHRSSLNKNKHKNTALQNAWNKYGEENFNFSVIFEFESEENMLIKEVELISKCTNCYNIAEGGLGGNSTKNYTEEQKIKLSKKHSYNMKKRFSEVGTEQCNPFLNKTEKEKIDMIKAWSDCKKGIKNSKAKYFDKVLQIKDGVVKKIWNNVYEASADGVFNRKYIINCANHKPSFNSHKGYQWEWYKKR